MKKLFIVVALLSLTACSTIAGAGKDITGVAEWSRDKMGGK
jgi:predicted small secreted protein